MATPTSLPQSILTFVIKDRGKVDDIMVKKFSIVLYYLSRPPSHHYKLFIASNLLEKYSTWCATQASQQRGSLPPIVTAISAPFAISWLSLTVTLAPGQRQTLLVLSALMSGETLMPPSSLPHQMVNAASW